MFGPMAATFRQANESAMKVQHDMLRVWWPGAGDVPGSAADATADRFRSVQKQAMAAAVELLRWHREALDAQYGLAIQALEEAFRIGDARDPGVFLDRSGTFVRHGFDCARAVAEEQVKGLQAATDRWLELVARGVKLGAG